MSAAAGKPPERVGKISRRAVLGAALVAVPAAPALAAPALVGLRALDVRTLSFDCANTGEKLKNVTYWDDGRYIPAALAEINYALRDFQSGDVFPIAPAVLDLLHRIGRQLDTDCRFELYSGYRSPKTNAMLRRLDSGVAVHSLHMKGLAVDISLPGRSLRKIFETARTMQMGGVGYYPDADFLHVDVGRVRHWVGLG